MTLNIALSCYTKGVIYFIFLWKVDFAIIALAGGWIGGKDRVTWKYKKLVLIPMSNILQDFYIGQEIYIFLIYN